MTDKSKARMGNQNGRKFDPEDYAEEFALLTSIGMVSSEIIRRSNPSRAWFQENIRDLVEWSICEHCNLPYRVKDSHSITVCASYCGTEVASRRHLRMSR